MILKKKLKQNIAMLLILLVFVFILAAYSLPKHFETKAEAPSQENSSAVQTEKVSETPLPDAADIQNTTDKLPNQEVTNTSTNSQEEAKQPQTSEPIASGQEINNADTQNQINASENGDRNTDNAKVEATKLETAKLEAVEAFKQNNTIVSRGAQMSRSSDFLLPWFNYAEKVFKIGTVATVKDIETGISFKVKRTYGDNHADAESLTAKDTELLRKIAGGSWSWERRAIVVEISGRKIAASMNMMPHAGMESEPANQIILQRSADYGEGVNLDSVKGNNMDGHICIHFYESKTHDSDKVDEEHQNMITEAYKWLLKNSSR